MALKVDIKAERTLNGIINTLRNARLDADRSQESLAAGLPVRGRAISEWETRAIQPILKNLILWSDELGWRLVIAGWNGELRGPRQRSGEPWEIFVHRRLAWPLKSRRQAWGMSQTELGNRVGVSRDSIQRWELARVPPRPIALVVWAQVLGYRLALQPTSSANAAPKDLAGNGNAKPYLPGPRRDPARSTVSKW